MFNKIIGNPNDWHIEVYPKRAGDFGFCSISSVKYDAREAEVLADDIEEQINRHVDRVGHCRMIYDSYICLRCNTQYDTKKEAEECSHY